VARRSAARLHRLPASEPMAARPITQDARPTPTERDAGPLPGLRPAADGARQGPVSLDVVGGCTEYLRVVLELPEPTVAVEAQQLADLARVMVVVHVSRWRCSTDPAESTLRLEQRIRLLGRDAVPAREVVRPRPAHSLPGRSSPEVVARKAVGGTPRPRGGRAWKQLQRLHGPTVGTPLVAIRHGEVEWGESVFARLHTPGFAAPRGALRQVLATVERQPVPRLLVLAELRNGPVSPAVTTELRRHVAGTLRPR